MASSTPPPDFSEWRQRRAEAFADAPPDDTDDSPAHPELTVPAEPLPLPGTPHRQHVLGQRVLAGAELHQPGDVVTAPGQRADYRRLRNGHDKIDPKTGVATIRPEPGEKPATIRDRKTSTKQMHEMICPGLKALGQRLRELRGRRSLGQIALASGVLKETLRKLEAGRTPRPRIDTLLLLADWYRVSLDELVGRVAR